MVIITATKTHNVLPMQCWFSLFLSGIHIHRSGGWLRIHSRDWFSVERWGWSKVWWEREEIAFILSVQKCNCLIGMCHYLLVSRPSSKYSLWSTALLSCVTVMLRNWQCTRCTLECWDLISAGFVGAIPLLSGPMTAPSSRFKNDVGCRFGRVTLVGWRQKRGFNVIYRFFWSSFTVINKFWPIRAHY